MIQIFHTNITVMQDSDGIKGIFIAPTENGKKVLTMAEYIERETFINNIRNIHAKYGLKDNEEMMFSETDIIGIVECLPTANVVPVRHGWWIPEEHEDRVSPTMTHRYRWYHCSLCGRRLIGYSNPKDAPYCHCGAKMNEEATDNG